MKALLGDYPVTKLFKQKSGLEFADVKVPNTAFKRVVRDFEFEFAELAIMTYLLAKAHGKPFRLLPAVVTARFQHPMLVTAKNLKPKDLEGKRVGQRSYSVTTATWVRGSSRRVLGMLPTLALIISCRREQINSCRGPGASRARTAPSRISS